MQKGSRWRQHQLDELADLFWKGLTNQEIAEHFRCSVSRVKDALSYHGITCRSEAARRKNKTYRAQPPKEYRDPVPLPAMLVTVPEPKNRELHFMDAVEHRVCLWMDKNLTCCGHDRDKRSMRYCEHHHARSMRKNEAKND